MAFDIIHPDADAIECQIVDNVAQLLADSVARTPERVALEFFDHDITLTYTELFDQVRRVAAGLTARGVRKGTHVGMMLPNCVEFPVSWLAMAWVGAVCVRCGCFGVSGVRGPRRLGFATHHLHGARAGAWAVAS